MICTSTINNAKRVSTKWGDDMAEERQWLSQIERRRKITQMKEWTQKTPDPKKPNSGCFPLDHGTQFELMKDAELIQWFEMYKWALDEQNFKHLDKRKGG